MNEENLTPNDIGLLMEALETWCTEPGQSAVFSGFTGAIFRSKDEDTNAATSRMTSGMDKAKDEENQRRERAILLQAKLIRMKQRALVGQEFSR